MHIAPGSQTPATETHPHSRHFQNHRPVFAVRMCDGFTSFVALTSVRSPIMTRSTLRHARRLGFLCATAAAFALLGAAPSTRGADWPQWRGPNRDAKVSDFKAPKTWPKELKQQWKITVGEGVATPALVGDKLYV